MNTKHQKHQVQQTDDCVLTYDVTYLKNLPAMLCFHSFARIPTARIQWRNQSGARGDICLRAQYFGGAKLGSECHVIIMKCQMSDANNYNLPNVVCQQLLPSCKILSSSPRVAKWVVSNLSEGLCGAPYPAISARMWFDSRLHHNVFR